MLQFEDSFFEGEYREDFYVEPMMKKAWAVELEVLAQVSKVCQKYDIAYYASYGTLLGAVRHKGFIPWDDDVDISVKREEYVRLLKLLQQELPEGYFVHSYYTCDTHVQPWAAVMNTEYILTEAEQIKRFWGCPYVCGIDIIPLDYVSRDPQEDEVQLNLYGIVLDVAQRFEEYEKSGELYQYLPQIEQLTGADLHDDGTLRRQLLLLADQISGLYQKHDSDELTVNSSRLSRGNKDFKFPAEWFGRSMQIPFENIMVSAPVEYDKVLRVFYGDEYSVRKRQKGDHDYPFYKKQERFLNENHIHIPLSDR